MVNNSKREGLEIFNTLQKNVSVEFSQRIGK